MPMRYMICSLLNCFDACAMEKAQADAKGFVSTTESGQWNINDKHSHHVCCMEHRGLSAYVKKYSSKGDDSGQKLTSLKFGPTPS